MDHAHDQACESGLPGAATAHETKLFAGPQRQRDIAECLVRLADAEAEDAVGIKGLGDVIELQNGLAIGDARGPEFGVIYLRQVVE
jgi:hypothetical protein